MSGSQAAFTYVPGGGGEALQVTGGTVTCKLSGQETGAAYSLWDVGSRDDPLLSDTSATVTSHHPDVGVVAAAPTPIVIVVGEESKGTFSGRTSVATVERLGQQARIFPSHHGGFVGGDSPYAGQPEAFARTLRTVLTENH